MFSRSVKLDIIIRIPMSTSYFCPVALRRLHMRSAKYEPRNYQLGSKLNSQTNNIMYKRLIS